MIKTANLPFVKMGDLNEKFYAENIIERYGEDLERTGRVDDETHFTVYDWISNSTIVELKSRRVFSYQYPTTMIGYNKVKAYLEDLEYKEKKCFFLFAFKDGLYEWEANKPNFLAAGGMLSVRNAFDYNPKPNSYTTFKPNKLHFYIPMTQLVKICSKGCIVF